MPRLPVCPSPSRRTVARVAAAAAFAAAPAALAAQGGGAPAQDRALRADGAAVYQLSGAAAPAQPVAAAFDAADRLYVLDRGRRVVGVFDAAGRRVREVGAGALASPVALAVTTDDRVVVLDVARGLVVFGADGRLAGTHRVPGLDSHDTRGTLYAHPQGGVVVGARPAGADQAPRQHPLRTSTALAWFRLDGSAPRELRIARAESESTSGAVASQGGEMRMQARIRAVFSPEVRWAVMPDGRLAVVEGEEYRVNVAGSGRPARDIRRPVAPRAVSAADRERFLGRGSQGSGASGNSGGSMTMQIDPSALPFAQVMPAIQRIASDPAGRLWVQRAGPVWGQDGPVDVWGADGRYLGTLPAGPVPAAYLVPGGGGAARVEVRRLPTALR